MIQNADEQQEPPKKKKQGKTWLMWFCKPFMLRTLIQAGIVVYKIAVAFYRIYSFLRLFQKLLEIVRHIFL
jgi:hypothetical protein